MGGDEKRQMRSGNSDMSVVLRNDRDKYPNYEINGTEIVRSKKTKLIKVPVKIAGWGERVGRKLGNISRGKLTLMVGLVMKS